MFLFRILSPLLFQPPDYRLSAPRHHPGLRLCRSVAQYRRVHRNDAIAQELEAFLALESHGWEKRLVPTNIGRKKKKKKHGKTNKMALRLDPNLVIITKKIVIKKKNMRLKFGIKACNKDVSSFSLASMRTSRSSHHDNRQINYPKNENPKMYQQTSTNKRHHRVALGFLYAFNCL